MNKAIDLETGQNLPGIYAGFFSKKVFVPLSMVPTRVPTLKIVLEFSKYGKRCFSFSGPCLLCMSVLSPQGIYIMGCEQFSSLTFCWQIKQEILQKSLLSMTKLYTCVHMVREWEWIIWLNAKTTNFWRSTYDGAVQKWRHRKNEIYWPPALPKKWFFCHRKMAIFRPPTPTFGDVIFKGPYLLLERTV